MKSIESVQYEAALAVSGAWRGSSSDKLYKELGWESLYHRRNSRRIILLKELLEFKNPYYLYNIISPYLSSTNIRHRYLGMIKNYSCRLQKFAKTFFPSTIMFWNSLDTEIKKLPFKKFKNIVIQKIRPLRNIILDNFDNVSNMYLTWLRVGLSPLKEHKFLYNFADTSEATCSCKQGPENTKHYMLLCSNHSNARDELFLNIGSILPNFATMPNKKKLKILLYGDENFTREENKQILTFSQKYIVSTNRFKLDKNI